MKIIKKGRNPEEDLFHGQCCSCKSEMEALRKELAIEWDQRENGEFGRANCPVCGYGVIFYPVEK